MASDYLLSFKGSSSVETTSFGHPSHKTKYPTQRIRKVQEASAASLQKMHIQPANLLSICRWSLRNRGFKGESNMETTTFGHSSHKTKYPIRRSAASETFQSPLDSAVISPQIDVKSLGAMFNVIYSYAKAYTLRGLVISIISTSLLAVHKLSDLTPSFFVGVFQAVIGCWLANSYVAAINQLSDIDIDKVNKPYLPLPSGQLSVKSAIRLTSLYAILGFCLGWITHSWPLKIGLLIWYAIGTAYSVHLPLLRWKNNPALAAGSISIGQGVGIHILLHLHAQTFIHGRSLNVSTHAIFASGIMCIFGLVAALFKDIPDIEGDRINGVNSLASQIGIKPVFWLCICLLELACGVAILLGLSSTYLWTGRITVISHIIIGFIIWREANLVDLQCNEALESYYRFIWKLRDAENLLVLVSKF